MPVKLKNIDVVILCGGLGKRLRKVVSDRPKSLALIRNRPFLDILLGYLLKQGFKRFVLCTGFQGRKIRDYFTKHSESKNLKFSFEDTPLGTGGAIKKAKRQISSDTFLVLNGDTFCEIDFKSLLKAHLSRESLLTIVLTKHKKNKNTGKVKLDKSKRVVEFSEKARASGKYYNSCGIYLMQKDVFSFMRKNKFSLEYDLLPSLILKKCFGFITNAGFIDIGTPQEYKLAQRLIT